MNYCLNYEDIGNLVELWGYSGDSGGLDVVGWLDDARSWETRLICIVLFFARTLERGGRDASVRKELVRRLYSTANDIFLEIQELDANFVEYMLRHARLPGETLEDALISLQLSLSEYDYANALRI